MTKYSIDMRIDIYDSLLTDGLAVAAPFVNTDSLS
jgi:hypothetical protein